MKKILILFSILSFFSCSKLVEVDAPVQFIVGKDIFNSNATAASVLSGIYTNMSQGGVFTGKPSITVGAGLSADELVSNAMPEDVLTILFVNGLSNNGIQLQWNILYQFIFRTNAALEGVAASKGISEDVRTQLTGEAKFLRAFFYFYLVTLYGDVPLVTHTDANTNRMAGRTPVAEVYNQIIADLKDAMLQLNDDYTAADVVTPVLDRFRPNKMVAAALLARVYLFTEQWDLAEETTSMVLDRSAKYLLEPVNKVFVRQSAEAIWQLQSVGGLDGMNTKDASLFVLASGGSYTGIPGPNTDARPVYLSNSLYDSFESGDLRKENWLDTVSVAGRVYPFAYKYKLWMSDTVGEHLIVFRLAEQYLIRAEARAHNNKITGAGSAAEDLNRIRKRAGLGETSASSLPAMLDAILQERRIEFFTEWGHRWLDLRRMGKIDEVMRAVAPSKGAVWEPYKALYPIPVEDIQRSPALRGHQNPGYPEQ